MSLTVTDLFAGAGGSSTGMVTVPGVNVRIADEPLADDARVQAWGHEPREIER